MSQIKSKNTKPELLVRRFLFVKGFRYRLHVKDLPGKPDLVFPKLKTVIFVHGCFWHGHDNCKYFVIPKTRSEWWSQKIEKNIKIDSENLLKLRLAFWNVLTIFECELKSTKKEKTLYQTLRQLNNIKKGINIE